MEAASGGVEIKGVRYKFNEPPIKKLRRVRKLRFESMTTKDFNVILDDESGESEKRWEEYLGIAIDGDHSALSFDNLTLAEVVSIVEGFISFVTDRKRNDGDVTSPDSKAREKQSDSQTSATSLTT